MPWDLHYPPQVANLSETNPNTRHPSFVFYLWPVESSFESLELREPKTCAIEGSTGHVMGERVCPKSRQGCALIAMKVTILLPPLVFYWWQGHLDNAQGLVSETV